MATQDFNANWMGQYRNGTYYGGGSPIRAGNNYDSFVGAPSSLRDAINSSSTTPTVTFHFYVNSTNGQVDFGAHREVSNKGSGSRPWYKYLSSLSIGTGWRSYTLSSTWVNEYKAGTVEGVVMYSTSHYSEAVGATGTNRAYYRVTGTWANMHVNVNGTWRQGTPYINVSGTWREAKEVYINVGGTWRLNK